MKFIYKQAKISDFLVNPDLMKNAVANLEMKLQQCTKFMKIKYWCKQCEAGWPIKHKCVFLLTVKHYCENRYCNIPECCVMRFSRTLNSLLKIPEFKGLKFLSHFSIGFPLLDIDDFKKNFRLHKKRYESVIHAFFKRMRKKGFDLRGIRVWDFAFTTKGKVFPHFHFGTKALGKKRWDEFLRVAKSRNGVIREQIRRQRIKTSFYLKPHRLGSIIGVLSYLAIRSVGLYKYDQTTNTNYEYTFAKGKGTLLESIKNNKYFTLRDLLTPEEYLLNFYNKSHILTFGKFTRPSRHGSSIAEDIDLTGVLYCQEHGYLTKKQCRIEIIIDDYEPPPLINEIFQEILNIEYKNI